MLKGTLMKGEETGTAAKRPEKKLLAVFLSLTPLTAIFVGCTAEAPRQLSARPRVPCTWVNLKATEELALALGVDHILRFERIRFSPAATTREAQDSEDQLRMGLMLLRAWYESGGKQHIQEVKGRHRIPSED